MSSLSQIVNMVNAFWVALSMSVFPFTVVKASILILSGALAAKKIAIASSIPGSVSIMTLSMNYHASFFHYHEIVKCSLVI